MTLNFHSIEQAPPGENGSRRTDLPGLDRMRQASLKGSARLITIGNNDPRGALLNPLVKRPRFLQTVDGRRK